MKTVSLAAPVFPSDPSPVVLAELAVRPLLPAEPARAAALLEQEHYLGAGPAVGHTLTQVVQHHGRWVALLVWGPAALKLTDREAWIGWSDSQRAARLGLVVQNRRFLVLAATRLPNLASRALALAVQALPAAWQAAHGYPPLLAETFTDLEQFEGTCYKAAGWVPGGLTKGFGRHRADFYQRHGRPKKLWLKQHLRIKAFYGRSQNAVRTQLWVALGVYALVAIVRKQVKSAASLFGILQVLSVSVFDKTPVATLFAEAPPQSDRYDLQKHLCLWA